MAKGNASSSGDGRQGDELKAAPGRAGSSAAKSPSGPTGAAEKSTGAAKKSTGAAKKSTGAANKSTGAAKKSTGAAGTSAGAAKKRSTAAKKSAGAAKKTTGAGRAGAGAATRSGGTSDLRGELRGFIREHPDGWGHDEWSGLVNRLGERGHDTGDTDRLGMHLEKERLADRLEAVKGLGAQRVRSLVDRFGTLYSMRNADVDDIVRAGKVSRDVADRIKDRLG